VKTSTTSETVLVMTALFVFAVGAYAADGIGKVCVQPISSGPKSNWKGNDTGATERSVFTVRIDDLPAIRVSTNSSGVFTNLALTKRHLIKIQLDNKPLTSFWFSFDSRGDHLRLWYNEFYGTWQLWDARASARCACPKQRPSTGRATEWPPALDAPRRG
jgi:hypothetical protein